MRVGLNLLYLVPGHTGGMEVYAREFVPALRTAAPELEVTAFINREAAAAGLDLGPGIDPVVVPVHSSSRIQWVLGEQLHLPPMARARGIDVVHSLASTAPGWGSFARVTTIHDLIYRRFPEAHFGLRTLGMRVLVPLAARRSDLIIAISRSTANDLERFLAVPSNKINVIPQGPGDPPRQAVSPEPEEEVRRRWQLGDRPVVLTLSAKRPVKNLMRLLEALALIPGERRPVLIMPGYPTPYEEDLRKSAQRFGLQDDLRMPGWLPEEQIEGLWRVAGCFVFPSLYEGFGFPVLEAMRRGVPVACSDRSSLPEIAGDAVRYFNPEQPHEIAEATEELLSDRSVAGELIQRGFARAGRFTWAETARRTAEVYERAVSDFRPRQAA